MASGHARVLQQTDPRKCRLTYQGITKFVRGDAEIFENNPRIARPGETGNFQELQARDGNNMRPYHTAKTAERWTYNLDFRPDVGEIYFSDAEREFGARHAARVIIEPHVKAGASPNKDWAWHRWNALVQLMLADGIRPAQLGPLDTRTIDGVELIVTPSFRMACAVLSGARGAVLPDGGLHHAAAALGVPAVVIMGGFTPTELTGYPMHRNLGVSLGNACGMRQPCKHCAEAMAKILPEQVFYELMEELRA